MKNLNEKQTELKNKLNPVIEIASQMLLVGTLIKNVVRYFENKGFPNGAAVNITEMAQIRASQFSNYSIR